jgi:hypothetical protein
MSDPRRRAGAGNDPRTGRKELGEKGSNKPPPTESYRRLGQSVTLWGLSVH